MGANSWYMGGRAGQFPIFCAVRTDYVQRPDGPRLFATFNRWAQIGLGKFLRLRSLIDVAVHGLFSFSTYTKPRSNSNIRCSFQGLRRPGRLQGVRVLRLGRERRRVDRSADPPAVLHPGRVWPDPGERRRRGADVVRVPVDGDAVRGGGPQRQKQQQKVSPRRHDR